MQPVPEFPGHHATGSAADPDPDRILVDLASEILLATDQGARPAFLNGSFWAYSGTKSGNDPEAAWEQAIHPDDLGAYRAGWGRARKRPAPFELSLRLRRADGAYRTFELRVRPVRNSAGAIRFWAGRCAEASEPIEARRAAERALAARTHSLSAAAHDLRQPLQAMRLFLHILERRPLDDDIRNLAQVLADSLRSGEDLVNSLGDLAAIEEGTVDAHPVAFGLEPLLRRVTREHASRAAAKGLALRSFPRRVTLRSDPAIVERILGYLLGNAIRLTERGKVLLGARRRGDKLRIEVWDTGPGLPESELDAIFDHRPDGEGRQGLGLGLATAAGLAALLDTGVSVRSRPGRGSVFSLELPIVAESPRGAAAGAEGGAALFAGLRVLLLGGDPARRVHHEHAMAQWGAEIASAGTLEDAEHLIGTGTPRPDLLVADLDSPGCRSGLSAIEALRARLRESLPAILFTGEAGPDGRYPDACGDINLLRQSAAPDRLAAAMAEALAGR